MPSSQQELTNILSHRSDISTLSTASQPSISSLLMKNHPSLSILNDTLPYLKSNTSLAEDLNILGSSTMDDHHSVYESKIKLPCVFDNSEPDTGLIPISQSDMKILGSGSSNKVKNLDFHCFIVYFKLLVNFTLVFWLYYLHKLDTTKFLTSIIFV